MKNLLILLSLTAFLSAAGMEGQGKEYSKNNSGENMPPQRPGSPPWEKLGVDKSKQEALEKLHASKRMERQKVMLEMEKKDLELKEILLTSMDMAKIKKNCDERGAVWSRLQILEFETDAKVKELLSAEQWEKYILFKIRMHDGRFEGGSRHGPKGK